MVSFIPTDDQQLLIETINRYALNDLRQHAHDADESGATPANSIQAGWQMGLVPSAIPEELGGLGELSAVTGVLAAEALAFGDLAAALEIMTPALVAYPVALYGTAEQRERLLPLFLDEKAPRVTAALLEPGIFFDPHELQTTVSADGLLNGVKAYVPLAEGASHLLVYASNTVSGQIEAWLIAGDAPGVSIDKREQLMGVKALPTYRLRLTDVKVEPADRLGGAVGIDYQRLLDRMNVALATLAVGVARASFEYARDYAKQRVQFGKPIAQNQAIAFMLAEMAIDIDSARLMAWEAAVKLDAGQDATREAYLARQFADQMVLKACDSGVQILGGYGFIREYPAERWLRNGRGFPSFTGLAII
jgi:alkylation response protein AidB-like acyl-CoA dehydrogenase